MEWGRGSEEWKEVVSDSDIGRDVSKVSVGVDEANFSREPMTEMDALIGSIMRLKTCSLVVGKG